jgi:hypothetical protein
MLYLEYKNKSGISMRSTYLYKCLKLLLIVFFSFQILADVVQLKDGSVIVGKIIKRTPDSIVIANSFGEFTVPRNKLTAESRTNNYREDVKKLEEIGVNQSEESIKKNVEAGEKKLRSTSTSDSSDNLFMGDSIFTGISVYNVFGDMNSIFTAGFEGGAAYNWNYSKFLISEQLVYIPDLRVEIDYISFNNNNDKANFVPILSGPSWIIPLQSEIPLYLTESITSGPVFTHLESDSFSKDYFTFLIRAESGIGYKFDENIGAGIDTVFQYIYDTDVSFYSLGFGIAFHYFL